MGSEFDSAIAELPIEIRKVLSLVDKQTADKVQEIRIRKLSPLMITCTDGSRYVDTEGQVSSSRPYNPFIPSKRLLADIYRVLCGGSIYAHTSEMKQGYFTMKSGHRAGICGIVSENFTFREITSVNIRIARQILGVAENLAKLYAGGGLIIAGPPGSGKTTMLRDFVRIMSEKRGLRVTVVDTRGEISGIDGSLYLGDNTDVFTGIPKPEGIEMAVRCMNPHIVAFDEIGTREEAQKTLDALNSGVYAVTTAHIRKPEELFLRPQTDLLLKSGAVSTVALLTAGIYGHFTLIDNKAVEKNAVY